MTVRVPNNIENKTRVIYKITLGGGGGIVLEVVRIGVLNQ